VRYLKVTVLLLVALVCNSTILTEAALEEEGQ
jgi:hypothetical protein